MRSAELPLCRKIEKITLRLPQNPFYILFHPVIIVHDVRTRNKAVRLLPHRLPVLSVHLPKMVMKYGCGTFHRPPDELPYLQLHENRRTVNVPFLHTLALPFRLERRYSTLVLRLCRKYGVRLAELTAEHLCGLARCDTPVKMAVAGCKQNIGFLIPVPVRKLCKILTHQYGGNPVAAPGIRHYLQIRDENGRRFVQHDK